MSVIVKHLTLLMLHDETKILLGMKLRGFGVNKYNGFGGKVEPGETLLQGALREMREESGLAVAPAAASLVGHLSFTFEGSVEHMSVSVFRAPASAASGEIKDSDEMAPRWFALDAIPYSKMWADDCYWLPHLLAGRRFVGSFDFRGGELLSHTLDVVAELPLHLGNADAKLVHSLQAPLTPQG